jgi:hypothetical protein
MARCSTPECVLGWIDREVTGPDGHVRDVTSPCPVCRPEQAAALAVARTPAEFGRLLRARGEDDLVSAADVAG